MCTKRTRSCRSWASEASSSGVDAVELLLVGACAVQVGTATFADPAASARVLTELGDWCRRHGVQALGDVIGGIT